MKCVHCGNEQANGAYCWKCGTRLKGSPGAFSDQVQFGNEQTVDDGYIEKVDTSVHLESFKKHVKEYGNYFFKYVKHPSISFSSQHNELVNGIVSLVLYAIIFGLSLLLAIKSIVRQSVSNLEVLAGVNYGSPSYFSVFFTVFLFVIVCMSIVLLGLVIVNKYFGPDHTGKKIMIIYSAHSLPAIVSGLAAFGLILIKPSPVGIILLVASLVFILILAPSYVIGVLLSKRPKGIDPLYGFAIYAMLFIFLFVSLYRLLEDSAISSYMTSLLHYL